MLSDYSNEIAEDDYGNLRYIGANPNNYVQFNNELWRIIGVMKDIENADGTKEDKVKLIRNESIGKYFWDRDINAKSNDWSESALQKVLNEGAYWSRTSGDCPSDENGATTTCDFSSTGLTEDAKNMISVSVWNSGGNDQIDNTTKKSYTIERGGTGTSGISSKWTGKVGLMYPSDYGYATSGGATKDRNSCLDTRLHVFGNVECQVNDWLYTNNIQRTMMPYTTFNYSVFILLANGNINYNGWYTSSIVRPAVYLNSSIGIESGGVGSSTSPLVLK